MVCAVNADVQFRAIPAPRPGFPGGRAGDVCLVKCGALGGTRTPNLLIRSEMQAIPLGRLSP